MDEINTTPMGNNDNNQPGQNNNPYAAPQQPQANVNPYNAPQQNANPYGAPQQNANPYGAPQQNANPYGAPQQNANPYGAPQQNINPYAQQGNSYQNTQSTYSYDYGTQPEQPQGSPVLGIFSLVISIIALLCCCLPYGISIILGVIAIVLAIISLVGKKPKKGLSIAGIIISIFAVLCAIPMLLLTAIVGGVARDFGMSTTEFIEAMGNGSISEDEFMEAYIDYLVQNGYLSESEGEQMREQLESQASTSAKGYEIVLE